MDTSALQIMGKAVWKVMRHDHALNTPFTKHRWDDLSKARLFDAALSKLLLIAGKGKNVAMRGLLLSPIDFQIAHDDVTAAAETEIDEWVGHEHARGIKHVRIVIGVSDNQEIL